MEVFCDLQVDVNGQQIFLVNKEILASFSSRLSSLFMKRGKNAGRKMKLIFQDFPGGPTGFELIARFCYNNGIIEITHSNVVILNHVSKYMEMNKNSNLIDKTHKFLQGIDCWTWSELLLALNQSQCLLLDIDYVSSIKRLVDELIERLALPSMTTSSSLSSKCSSFRSSCDSKSTQSTKTSGFRRFWWFGDLSKLNVCLIDMVVREMVIEKSNHRTISKFLFYYQRVRVLGASKVTRVKIIKRVINLLSLLDKKSISIKGLFDTLRIASNLKLSKSLRSPLELLIGSQLDQATLDDLLLPPPHGKKYTMYNVNLVLRFLKNFLLEGNISYKVCSYRLKRVARLVDLYANEIAPDARLKPSTFVALTMVIPDSARDCYDKIYQAIDIYLQVHPRLGEEQKMKLYSVLNCDKLSPQVLNQLSRNTSFPLIAIVKALIHQNPKLKSTVKDAYHLKVFSSMGCAGYETEEFMHRDEVLVKELSTNEKIRAHLQRMGWTVIELEKVFGKLQTQNVANVMTPNVCCIHNVRHLPKLCS